VFWAFGFAVGLIAGFSLPVIGDVIAVIIFTGSVLYFQHQLLKEIYPWSKNFIRRSVYGFVIGLTISFVFTLIADKFLGLSLAHILAFPIVLFVTIYYQFLILKKHYSNAQIWIYTSVVSTFISFFILVVLSQYVDLRFDLLDVRQQDYSAVIPWWFVGLLMGFNYGLFSGLVLRGYKIKLKPISA